MRPGGFGKHPDLRRGDDPDLGQASKMVWAPPEMDSPTPEALVDPPKKRHAQVGLQISVCQYKGETFSTTDTGFPFCCKPKAGSIRFLELIGHDK